MYSAEILANDDASTGSRQDAADATSRGRARRHRHRSTPVHQADARSDRFPRPPRTCREAVGDAGTL